MSLQGKSLLELSSLDKKTIESLFDLANRIRREGWSFIRSSLSQREPPLVSLVFLEPSTRTTSSFETAAQRSGYLVTTLHAEESSTKKGETLLDTLLSLDAMKPDVFVVRHGTPEKLSDIVPHLKAPVVSAGEGVTAHPTQALLDALTILAGRGKLEGERLLIIGDVIHSRVAASNVELMQKFGVKVAVCGPQEWSKQAPGVDYIENLKEGLKWATACMSLRIQRERHAQRDPDFEHRFIQGYQLNSKTMENLAKDAVVMHPGPFNRGVEISDEILNDSRCHIWKQVENGVYIRGALLAQILGVVK